MMLSWAAPERESVCALTARFPRPSCSPLNSLGRVIWTLTDVLAHARCLTPKPAEAASWLWRSTRDPGSRYNARTCMFRAPDNRAMARGFLLEA